MRKVYTPTEPEEPGSFCSGLAIGDSWFWYPNQNILQTLVKHPKISEDHSNIRLVGYLGAELQDYVGAGKYAKTIAHWLSPNFNDGFLEFYISGAGNDAVAYELALKEDCAKRSTPEECIDPEGMDDLLRKISSALGALIHNIRWAYRNDNVERPIFIHGYDYPTPDGRGFSVGPIHSGPWLGSAMTSRKVAPDLSLRYGITKILIDRLNEEVFKPFELPTNEIFHIDSRQTLAGFPAAYKADWANELHPTSAGFKKIFEECWLPKLRNHGNGIVIK